MQISAVESFADLTTVFVSTLGRMSQTHIHLISHRIARRGNAIFGLANAASLALLIGTRLEFAYPTLQTCFLPPFDMVRSRGWNGRVVTGIHSNHVNSRFSPNT